MQHQEESKPFDMKGSLNAAWRITAVGSEMFRPIMDFPAGTRAASWYTLGALAALPCIAEFSRTPILMLYWKALCFAVVVRRMSPSRRQLTEYVGYPWLAAVATCGLLRESALRYVEAAMLGGIGYLLRDHVVLSRMFFFRLLLVPLPGRRGPGADPPPRRLAARRRDHGEEVTEVGHIKKRRSDPQPPAAEQPSNPFYSESPMPLMLMLALVGSDPTGSWNLKSVAVNGKPTREYAGILAKLGGVEDGMAWRFRKPDEAGACICSLNDVECKYRYIKETKELIITAEEGTGRTVGVRFVAAAKEMVVRFKEEGKSVILTFTPEPF